jgi:hypothetical protein
MIQVIVFVNLPLPALRPLDCMNNAIADVVVVGRCIRDLAGKTGHCLKQIGAADHADDFVSAEDWQPFGICPLHCLR